MPRVGVRNRWLVPVLTCAADLGGRGLRRGLVEHERSPGGHPRAGQAAYDHQDWAAAERKAREQLRKDRDDPDALRLLGRALYRQGRDQAAAAIFERLGLRTRWPPRTTCWSVRSFVRSRKLDLAIKDWREGRAARPEPLRVADRARASLFPAGPARRRGARGRAVFWPSLAGMLSPSFCEARFAPSNLTRLAPPEPSSAPWHDPTNGSSWSTRTSFASNWLAACSRRASQPSLASELRQLTGQDRDPETCWLLSRCDLQEGITTEAAVSVQARLYRESHPMEPEPAPFVGEAQCAALPPGNVPGPERESPRPHLLSQGKAGRRSRSPQRPITDPANAQVSHAFHKRRRRPRSGNPRRWTGLIRRSSTTPSARATAGLTLVGHDPEGRSLEYRLSFYPDRVGWDVTSGQVRQPGQQAALYQGRSLSHR